MAFGVDFSYVLAVRHAIAVHRRHHNRIVLAPCICTFGRVDLDCCRFFGKFGGKIFNCIVHTLSDGLGLIFDESCCCCNNKCSDTEFIDTVRN